MVGSAQTKRCGKINEAGVGASTACRVACRTCLLCHESCCDSATWSHNKESKDCGWVGAKRHRCWLKSAGSAGVKALEACPASCGTCSMASQIMNAEEERDAARNQLLEVEEDRDAARNQLLGVERERDAAQNQLLEVEEERDTAQNQLVTALDLCPSKTRI